MTKINKPFKFVERSKTPLGGKRWIYNCNHLHKLGPVFWCVAWMNQELDKGHTATYNFNGHLIARTATYTGV